MYINSPGGVVTAGLAIYDTMQYVKPPIATLCVGQAGALCGDAPLEPSPHPSPIPIPSPSPHPHPSRIPRVPPE
eukprot:scaffold68726_cov75-Phaeocystis_antarctica.AAC.8